jgi:hypothetical protein
MLALANDCVAAAGPGHAGELSSVLTGIYNYVTSEVRRSFTALRRPEAGDGFEALFALPGFDEQMLWDYLTGDPGKIAVHNHLAEQLESEPVKDTLVRGIRGGNYATRTEQSRNDADAPSAGTTGGQTSLADPGLDETDPRQLLYTLLSSSGLSLVLSGPVPVEEVLRVAVELAPSLRDSSHLGRGFFRLGKDPETTWTAVEGRHGASVVVACAPGSDSSLILEAILTPFQNAPRPLSLEMVHLGSSSPDAIRALTEVDVVPAWEAPAFAHLRTSSNGWATLRPWARRAARSWERPGLELYGRTVQDVDGDSMHVLFGLIEGRTLLVLGLGPVAEYQGQYQALAENGPYWIEHIEGTVAFVREVPEGTDGAELEGLAQRIADDFATGVAALREASAQSPTPALPPEASDRPLWERLEEATEECTAGRPVHWPALALYTVTERVREAVAEGESTFDSVNVLAHQLRARRRAGFEYSWRASGDSPISPSWLTIRSARLDPETGRAVACGHLTHEVWGMDPAHDLGAIDGRNNFTFTEQGHPNGLFWPASALYVGSARSGAFLPLDARANVVSVDLHGPSGTIGVLEHLGSSTGAVAVYEPAGRRRLLTVVEEIAGNEPIRFSGDGAWLLVTRSRSSTLIEVSSGRRLELDVANSAWWPLGESALLTIRHEDGRILPSLFSLARNEYIRSLPQITLDVPMLKEYPYLWFPEVSPDGQEILALTPAGVSDEHQTQHGTGDRVARIDLSTGAGRIVHSPFLNPDQTLERDAREARWTQRAPQQPIELHPDLARKLDGPRTEHEYLAPSRWADEAEAILVHTLNTAIELTQAGQPMAHLMPEVLAALSPVAHDTAIWERRSAWLTGLQRLTSNLTDGGPGAGGNAEAWRRYGTAIAAIQAGRPDLVEPVSLTLP